LIHHVIHRGNNRQRIFVDAADYGRYVDLLDEGVARFAHDILAFCLMPNHVHLVIRTQEVPLSDVIQNAAFRFAMWSNRRLGRVGHVFQGRFRSFVVTHDAYLLSLVRYVHHNPVRAGMVSTPEQHAWNTHRDYLGSGRFPWVRPEPVLEIFGSDLVSARAAYRAWSNEEPAEPTHPDPPSPADPPSIRPIRRARLRSDVPLACVMAAVATEFGVTERELVAPSGSRFSPAALVVALVLRECGNVALTHWAKQLGRDGASLSRSLRRLETRAAARPGLRASVARVRQAVGLPPDPSVWGPTG
jgi:REP element-mobilizing transposase RayT